jgi:CO/xanthine dehydrogenase FAD-binding subunit
VQELHYDYPASLKDAVGQLGGGSIRLLAGGTDLIPQLREGRRAASRVVNLKRIPELNVIERRGDGGWRIGAAVTIGKLAQNVAFASEHAALLASAKLIGSLQIQNRASLGGNVCNAAPSADAVPLLYCLDAAAEIAGPSGVRTIPVASVAIAPGRTSLADGEILVALVLPAVRPRTAAAYQRFTPRREMDIAIAGAGAWIELDAGGAIIDAKITLASVAPTPLVATQAQLLLIGSKPSLALFTEAASVAAQEARPISDTRGSADYRRHLVAVLTRRVLASCAAELGFKVE